MTRTTLPTSSLPSMVGYPDVGTKCWYSQGRRVTEIPSVFGRIWYSQSCRVFTIHSLRDKQGRARGIVELDSSEPKSYL